MTADTQAWHGQLIAYEAANSEHADDVNAACLAARDFGQALLIEALAETMPQDTFDAAVAHVMGLLGQIQRDRHAVVVPVQKRRGTR